VLCLGLCAPLLFLGAAMDERRRADNRIAHGDERYALVAQAGRTFVISYDPDTGAAEADSSLGAFLGLTPFEQARPDWVWQHVHPNDAAALRERWASGRGGQARELATTEFRFLASDGRVHWFRNDSIMHRVVADEPRLIGTLTDVTDLKAAQLAIEQRNRELAHVARTAVAGELAAALAHEIRQPLTALLINSQTAMRVLDAQPRDPEAVREILQQLAADGRRAGEVIQRMRAFAKKGELQRGPMDLNAVVREAVQLVRHDAIRRRVEFRFALSHEPLIVVGDRVQLQQVALNLVLNALEAIADKPLQSVRLVSIESARAASHTAMFTVRDTGPGIPIERQEAIFAPFVTSKPNGLGMGLAISRTIVEAHGGVIWCESEPAAGGAAFTFAIPLGGAHRR
jgi:signal transduction histidine kinase